VRHYLWRKISLDIIRDIVYASLYGFAWLSIDFSSEKTQDAEREAREQNPMRMKFYNFQKIFSPDLMTGEKAAHGIWAF
jgi:hypothetical protein